MITPYLILIQLLFFSSGRLLFWLWNGRTFQGQSAGDLGLAFLVGPRFDLSAACMVGALPFFLELATLAWRHKPWRRWSIVLSFLLLQWPGMIFTLGDSEFVNFTGRRMTFDSLFHLRELPGKFWQIVDSYLLLFFISCAITAVTWFCYFWVARKVQWPRQRAVQLAWILGGLVGLVIGARGGLQKKPIGFAHAQIFTHPMMNNLVMDSTFTFLQTIKRESLPQIKYFADRQEMLAELPGSWQIPSALEGKRFSQPQNVVFIILESFNWDYMGRPFGDRGYTPFLDSLAERGIFFQNHYANARRSIEGIGALLGGIPAWMNEPFLSSQYMSNYFLGIGSLLAKKNYQTSFFHGGHNGTMYFDSFMKSLGVEKYFGANEYPTRTDDDGTWGIYDGPFLQWSADQISGFQEPFFSAIFTLSSHNPFRLPPGAEGQFPTGPVDILPSIGYADESLRQFFAKIEKLPWYQNTLFVLTADHTYKSARPEWNNEIGEHRIPLVFFHPAWEKNPKLKPAIDTQEITSQIDLLPSILDFLGAETPERNYLARSVFVPGDRFAVTFVDGKYHLIAKDYFLTLSRDNQFRFYKGSDVFEREPLDEPAELKLRLEKRLKACQQYFSEGLWDNRLYYPIPK